MQGMEGRKVRARLLQGMGGGDREQGWVRGNKVKGGATKTRAHTHTHTQLGSCVYLGHVVVSLSLFC